MKKSFESANQVRNGVHSFANFFLKETLCQKAMGQVRGGDGGGSGTSSPPPPK